MRTIKTRLGKTRTVESKTLSTGLSTLQSIVKGAMTENTDSDEDLLANYPKHAKNAREASLSADRMTMASRKASTRDPIEDELESGTIHDAALDLHNHAENMHQIAADSAKRHGDTSAHAFHSKEAKRHFQMQDLHRWLPSSPPPKDASELEHFRAHNKLSALSQAASKPLVPKAFKKVAKHTRRKAQKHLKLAGDTDRFLPWKKTS